MDDVLRLGVTAVASAEYATGNTPCHIAARTDGRWADVTLRTGPRTSNSAHAG